MRLNVKRILINIISAITNQDKVRFKAFEWTMNADILIDFVQRLIGLAKQKVYLILDNLRAHHTKVFKAWLDRHGNEIKVFYQPSYSPELNPDEYVNCDLKAGVHSGKSARSKQALKEKVRGNMKMLQRKPNWVVKYFESRKIQYAPDLIYFISGLIITIY